MVATTNYLKAWNTGKRKDEKCVSQEDKRGELSGDRFQGDRRKNSLIRRAAADWSRHPQHGVSQCQLPGMWEPRAAGLAGKLDWIFSPAASGVGTQF